MNKVALIYGNGSYPESPLRNPVNDAESIKEKLASLGFHCIIHTNAAAKEMEQGLRDFAEQSEDSEIGLFFFAGHGMQISGKNYLTVVDTNFQKEVEAKYSSLPLDKVIERGRNRTSIIILDACRNNPYERMWQSSTS